MSPYDSTDYRPFVQWVRRCGSDGQIRSTPLTVIDLSGQPLEQLLDWCRHAQDALGWEVPLNLFGWCQMGGIPAWLSALAQDDLPDLPGMHRMERLGRSMTLTLTVRRTGQQSSTLASEVCAQADVVLVRGLSSGHGCVGLPAWVELVRPDGVIMDLEGSGRWHDALSVLGDRAQASTSQSRSAWLDGAGLPDGACVTVVGAGIAGMTVSAELVRRGFNVTVLDAFDPFGPDGVHCGHLGAALSPLVSADDNIRSRLSRAGCLMADRLWRTLPDSIGQRCGVLQLQKPQGARRQVDLAQVAAELDLEQWARAVDPGQASALAGMPLSRPGLWMPGGWVVKVTSLLKALGDLARLQVRTAVVDRIERLGGKWVLRDRAQEVVTVADAVVLCNAGDAKALLERSGILPEDHDPAFRRLQTMHRLAGEITLIPAPMLQQGPRCIVGGDGYVLPSLDGWCVAGGTYVRDATQAEPSMGGRMENVMRAAALLDLPDLDRQMRGLAETLPAWGGWRAVVAGRLPVIGPVPTQPGLIVCTAGASRGLTWSALQASLLADYLQSRPVALERSLLRVIASGFL